MNNPRTAWVLVLAAFLVVAGSCVESKQPLSDEKTSTIDKRLIGTWQEDKSLIPLICRVRKSEGTRNAFDAELSDANGSGRVLLFTTTINSKGYMSFRALDKEAQKDRRGAYDIYQYRFVDNDTVEVRGMNDDVLKRAIAKRLLAGTVDKDNDATITDSPEGIKRYLEAHADECYTDMMLSFKRQK